MEIFLNGTRQQVKDNCSIMDLLVELELINKRLAVEVNQEIIPRSQFSTYALSTNDKVEIVHAIGGG